MMTQPRRKRNQTTGPFGAVDVKAEPPQGIGHLPIAQTSFAVLDFETTGLYAGSDRVIEMSVWRVDAGCQPRLVLDTLINPCRPVAATYVHGITDDDVADAPTFGEIAGLAAKAVEGCVVASYNISFDMPFLRYELAGAGILDAMPHVCLMYMRPMLGLGKRCRLAEACFHHGVELNHAHTAAGDALAAAKLLGVYLKTMQERNVQTFAELAGLHKYKFNGSFCLPPLRSGVAGGQERGAKIKSRAARLGIQ